MSSQERGQYEQNQSQSEESINTKDFLIGALIGGMVGAAAALFLAPKSGKELRSNLNEQAIVLKERTGQFRNTAKVKGTQLAVVAKEKTNILAQTVSKQSTDIVNKVKNMTPAVKTIGKAENRDIGKSDRALGDDIQRKLEETKKAFDETEYKYNQ